MSFGDCQNALDKVLSNEFLLGPLPSETRTIAANSSKVLDFPLTYKFLNRTSDTVQVHGLFIT